MPMPTAGFTVCGLGGGGPFPPTDGACTAVASSYGEEQLVLEYTSIMGLEQDVAIRGHGGGGDEMCWNGTSTPLERI
ncbi:hypothetical protein OF83DRAFT_1124485 [Amylostereum chailletii]|nr:hypothetical protein OF83DRAFT_1124485 [Amylostereum chailletii]